MSFVIYAFFVLVMVGIDQYTKSLVEAALRLGESVEIIPGFFDLRYVQNRGAGFSILQGQTVFFYVISVVALIAFAVMLYKSKTVLSKIALLLMIGGTIGNFIDRIMHVYVVDFLDFYIFGYDFPVFNVADAFLTVGVFLLIIDLWKEERHA